jgi:hypothetical protein
LYPLRFCDERRETVQCEGAACIAKEVQGSRLGILIESDDPLLAE